VRIGHNNFSGNALASFCDVTSLELLDITGLDGICDPFCFDEGEVISDLAIDVCDSVFIQRKALLDFLDSINAASSIKASVQTDSIRTNSLDGSLRMIVQAESDLINSSCAWRSNRPYKDWFGVTTRRSDVVKLLLPSNGMSGSLSPTLSNLTALESLSFFGNSFFGALPSSLGSLAMLQELDLRGNSFSGSIPVEYGLFPRLERLRLGHNSLDDDIENVLLSLQQLTSLTLIDLSDNSFFGTVPEHFSYLPKIEQIDFSGNRLTGSIPSVFESFTLLRFIDISGNDFSGSLSTALCDIATLRNVKIGGMSMCYPSCLRRHIRNSLDEENSTRCQDQNDDAFCALTSVTNVKDLIPNAFQLKDLNYQSFDDSRGSFLLLQKDIQVDGATSYAVVVDDWTDISYKEFKACDSASCDVVYYSSSGIGATSSSIAGVAFEIPSSSFYLYLEPKSTLYGNCPRAVDGFQCFGYSITISALISYTGWLDCDDAPIASFGTKLNRGETILVSTTKKYAGDYCSWEGVTCDDINSHVIELDLSNWGIEGSVVSELGLFSNLKYLNLANNKFTGTIPESLGDLSDLVVVHLQSNSLTGTIPQSLQNMGIFGGEHESDDKVLDLSFNLLKGSLGDFYCNKVLNNTRIDISVTSIDCYHSCWDELKSYLVSGDIQACAPSSVPTSTPSSNDKKSNSTNTPTWRYILIALLSALVFAILSGFFWYYNSKNRKRKQALMSLPIHKAIVDGVSKELILETVLLHASSAVLTDYDGKRAIDHAIDKRADDDVIYELVKSSLPHLKVECYYLRNHF
jgi:hypothetical protein